MEKDVCYDIAIFFKVQTDILTKQINKSNFSPWGIIKDHLTLIIQFRKFSQSLQIKELKYMHKLILTG